MRRRNILLVSHVLSEQIGTVQEHVRALETGIDGNVVKLDCRAAELVDLSATDVVILHYSLVIASRNYISERLSEKLADFNGLVVLFIQDEYRWIDRTAEAIRELGVDVVFSVAPKDTIRKVYHHPWLEHVRFEQTLTGFTSEALARLPVPDYESRRLDIGYRARKLPAWYGQHALQKWQIAERFRADATRYNLAVDISTHEADRIYGPAWNRFISSCRATLGTESGTSVCDFSGEIQASTEAHLARRPDTSFEELRELYFKDVDGRILINAMSPRCFEAAALRTLMILYPGDYNGILEAGRHFVLLQPDHANAEEVIDILRTPSRAGQFIRAAYEEIALSDRWGHGALIDHLNAVIREEAGPPLGRAFDKRAFRRLERSSRRAVRRQALAYSLSVFGVRLEKRCHDLFSAWLPQPIWRLVTPLPRAVFRMAKSAARRVLMRT